MSDYWFLRQRFGLRGVFIARRFVGEGLDELVGEDFDVGSSVIFEGICGLLYFSSGSHGNFIGGVVGSIIFFGDDDG